MSAEPKIRRQGKKSPKTRFQILLASVNYDALKKIFYFQRHGRSGPNLGSLPAIGNEEMRVMMDERLKQIAEALETQNDLFREWINLNRSLIEQNMKMRAEYFPLEMERARREIAMQERLAKDAEELNKKILGESK